MEHYKINISSTSHELILVHEIGGINDYEHQSNKTLNSGMKVQTKRKHNY
jgi:hypothetical protein